jgi:hypothetical protein
MLDPKTILGPVMRSFDMILKMPRVLGESMKAGLVASKCCTQASSYAENASGKECGHCKHVPILSESVWKHPVWLTGMRG